MRDRTNKMRLLSAGVIAGLAAFIASAAPATSQSVEKKDVTFMLDWTISGTHAPFFIPQEKGYYKAAGLNVRIDRGTGAANTAANVASGTYDFGWADVATMIGFNAQNPDKELTLVYISFQDSPLAIISLKKANIHKLKDLEGKLIGDQPGSASGAVVDVLTKAGTPDEIKINRKFTAPQLREPMLMRGDVDAIMAFDDARRPWRAKRPDRNPEIFRHRLRCLRNGALGEARLLGEESKDGRGNGEGDQQRSRGSSCRSSRSGTVDEEIQSTAQRRHRMRTSAHGPQSRPER